VGQAVGGLPFRIHRDQEMQIEIIEVRTPIRQEQV
jgi:hypothetical protein